MSPDLLGQILEHPARVAELSDQEARQLLVRVSALLAALAARVPASENGQPGDRLLTPAEAAARLGVRRSRIYDLTRAGALPAVRVGKYVRVRASALTQWVTDLEKAFSSGLSLRYNVKYEGQGAPRHPQAARANAGRIRPAPGGPLEHAGPGRARRAPDSPIGRQARPVARRHRPAPATDDDTDETKW